MLVDDKSDRREMIDFALQDIECALVACVSGDGDLLSAVQQCNPDVILIDIEAPGRDTLESLESELKKAHQQLNDRKVIDKAKGIIMKQRGLNEEQAYQAMRKLAMDTNRKIAEVAQNIIEAASILSG
ncbi:MAG: ANTAR domain-containing protein [Candidatus Thiodiazotropha sp. (ex. Lucinisca nassula)]|nr:ANTAR domain-containing protein [Candidatus Thiodiazotropha sp. (ex. Lucinisca nassula)]